MTNDNVTSFMFPAPYNQKNKNYDIFLYSLKTTIPMGFHWRLKFIVLEFSELI